jgi:hypothetical protein
MTNRFAGLTQRAAARYLLEKDRFDLLNDSLDFAQWLLSVATN